MSFGQSLIVYIISPILSAIVFLIFIQVILHWLVGFGILNLRNPAMRQVYGILERVTEPFVAPIRKVIPPFGGMDFSPLIAAILIQWFNGFIIAQKLYPALG